MKDAISLICMHESLIQALYMGEHLDESSQIGTEIKTALIYKQDQVGNDFQHRRVHAYGMAFRNSSLITRYHFYFLINITEL